MASGRIDESKFSSDEEQEVFPGFTIEEIDKIQQARQTQQEQNLLHNVDGEMEDSLDLPSQEKGSNSNVEVYAKEEEESNKSSNKESAAEKSQPNALQWSSTLREINVEWFSIYHGLTRDLGDNATAKDFFNVFINNAYIDKIIRFTIVYPCLKGDQTFTTTRAEILAYLGLNILSGIHELPQLAMCWDSDKFIGVEGFKKMIPKHNFMTLGKYLHLADLFALL